MNAAACRAGVRMAGPIRVLEARLSKSRPDHGIVTRKNLMFNQRNELVMEPRRRCWCVAVPLAECV